MLQQLQLLSSTNKNRGLAGADKWNVSVSYMRSSMSGDFIAEGKCMKGRWKKNLYNKVEVKVI